jgi:hypothetical protein
VEKSIKVGAAVVCAVAVLMVSGCSRRSQPSEQYAQAHQLFSKLYAAQLDDAYGDPAMVQVDALLRQVSQDSSDWRAAKELTHRIEEGRKRLQEAEAARKSAAAQASAPVPYQRMTPESPAQSAAAAAADAGASQPGPHMALSEFTSRFSGCFQQGERINVVGKGMFDTWELKDIANCRDRHPGFDQLYVLTGTSEVFMTVAKNLVHYEVGDAGTPAHGAQAAASSAR